MHYTNTFIQTKMAEIRSENKREKTYAAAILEATDQIMQLDKSVFVIGEGVPDPKHIFGTTKGLLEKYGKRRVMDMPISESAVTGICIGAALQGMRPIMVHQRLDFALVALDQIINNAAKWHYMFGGQMKVPIVIRMIIGRGWGQGTQHSQNLQAVFAHIPGLKVVMPSTAYDAKGLLMASVQDNNPVIFIEHRWLHNTTGHVPDEPYTVPIGPADVIRKGTDITIAATSYMTLEALRAAAVLEKAGISAEVIDVRTVKPLDYKKIIESVKKTGHLLVADLGYKAAGIAGDIIAAVCESAFDSFQAAPGRITSPDIPTPSTPELARYYYPRYTSIIEASAKMLGKSDKASELLREEKQKEPRHLDVPDQSFTGPF